MVDVVMLSDAKDSQKRMMTQRAITSILRSEKFPFHIIVVESRERVTYQGATTIHPNEAFNYNKYLKIGFGYLSNNEYLLIVNNDILASEGFASELIKGLEVYDTVSPANAHDPEHKRLREDFTEGYSIWNPTRFAGWAFMFKKSLFKSVPVDDLFDDRFVFWWSDNATVYALQLFGKRHALVSKAKVAHLHSKTLVSVGREKYQKLTYEQEPIFNEWKEEINKKYSHLHQMEEI